MPYFHLQIGSRLNIKMWSYRYKNSQYMDVYNRNSIAEQFKLKRRPGRFVSPFMSDMRFKNVFPQSKTISRLRFAVKGEHIHYATMKKNVYHSHIWAMHQNGVCTNYNAHNLGEFRETGSHKCTPDGLFHRIHISVISRYLHQRWLHGQLRP